MTKTLEQQPKTVLPDAQLLPLLKSWSERSKTYNSIYNDWRTKRMLEGKDHYAEGDFINWVHSLNDFRPILVLVSRIDFSMTSLIPFRGTVVFDLFYMVYRAFVTSAKAFIANEVKKEKTLSTIEICDQLPLNLYEIYLRRLDDIAGDDWNCVNYGYMLTAEFFIPKLPKIRNRIRKTGPFYNALKEAVANTEFGYDQWEAANPLMRKIQGWQAIVEYYILTGEIPLAMRYLTEEALRNNRYNTSTKAELIRALNLKRTDLVMLYIRHFDELSITMKRQHQAWIRRNMCVFLNDCKRQDKAIFYKWSEGKFDGEV